MQKVRTIREAADWFLSHSHGNCIAVNAAGEEKEVNCYPHALEHILGKKS